MKAMATMTLGWAKQIEAVAINYVYLNWPSIIAYKSR